MTTKAPALLLAAALAAPGAKAETLDATDVRAAAVAFVNRDEIGASVLAGRQVASVTARDALWVVRLSPSGYIVFSGDTAAEPVVAFSTNDYVEPDVDSAFAAMMACAQTNAAAARARASAQANANSLLMSASLASLTSSSASTRREAKWNRLLGKTALESSLNGVISLASVTYDEDSLVKIVSPFLETKWNQWQPYNDYAPVDPNTAVEGVYRGRYPCGCVATAYAQVLKYWQWPALMNESFSCDHRIYSGTMTIRFDAHEPFDWASMLDEYDYYSRTGNTYDMRGVTAERARSSVARLVSMAAVMAEMYYQTGGSGSNIGRAIAKNPWYEPGESLTRSTVGDDSFFSAVKSDLVAKTPVPVTVPGHQVVAHGWAEGSDGTGYVYLNYGWGGSSDGYYNITEETVDTYKGYIQEARVGHTPKRTAQVETLPVVSESNVTVKWHVPERLASEFSGYTLTVGRQGTETSSWACDFEGDQTGYGGFTAMAVSGIGNETRVIAIRPGSAATYEFTGTFGLTGHSMLTYFLRSRYASGLTLKVQGSFDGGDWEDIDVPTLATSNLSSSSTRQVFLGEKGGQTMRLRVVVTTTGEYYSSADDTYGIQLDDFVLSEVLSAEEETVTCDASARAYTFTNLTPGAAYSFMVQPIGTDTMPSAPMQTTVAGSSRVALPGGYALGDYAFVAGDENWSVSTCSNNEPDQSSILLGLFSGTLSVSSNGALTDASVFSFDWTATGYYSSGSAYDVLSVVFTPEGGDAITLWTETNTVRQATAQRVELSLADYAGRRGNVSVVFSHKGGQTSDSGATISNAKLTNVMKPDLTSLLQWKEVERVATDLPYIHSVTSISETSPAVQEGFYRECARGTNVFFVSCSENVTSLAARPSHLSLVPDAAVAVYPQGNGKFVVTVDGSAIPENMDRSRLILTLVASDANGTTAAKDLSLRFSSATAAETYEPPAEEKTTSSTPIPVPHAWLVEKGVVAEGSSDADFEAAAALDQDNDGQPTYAEYLCGTDPMDKDDVFKIFIEMVDGDPVISWTPTNAAASYFVQGVTNLVDETWVDTNAVNRAGLRFFRVRVEPR